MSNGNLNIELYHNTAPHNKIDKTKYITNKKEVNNVRFIEIGALNFKQPSLLLDVATDIEDVIGYNYCYIPKLHRYYFINSITTEGGLIRIDCSCDVLFSFKNDILNSTQYIVRSQTKGDKYMIDNNLPMTSKSNYIVSKFGSDVFLKNCDHIILETIGKGGAPD